MPDVVGVGGGVADRVSVAADADRDTVDVRCDMVGVAVAADAVFLEGEVETVAGTVFETTTVPDCDGVGGSDREIVVVTDDVAAGLIVTENVP